MGQVQSVCTLRDKETGRGCDCNIGPCGDATPRGEQRDLLLHLRPVQQSESSAVTSEQLMQENERLRREVERLNTAMESSTETTWQVFDVVERHYKHLEHHRQARLRRDGHQRLQEDPTIGYASAEEDCDFDGDTSSLASAPSVHASRGHSFSRCDRCCCMWPLREPQGGVCPQCEATVCVVSGSSSMTALSGPTVHSIDEATPDRRSRTNGSQAIPWKRALGTPGSSAHSTASTIQSSLSSPSGRRSLQDWWSE